MPEITNKTDDQKGAEAEVESFRRALGPFVTAAESTRMPMVFTDAKGPDNPIIFANGSFLSLTGYDREEVLGKSFNSLMARGAGPESPAQVAAAFSGTSEEDLIIHYRRKDASEFWADVFICPVRDDGGQIVQHFISLADLTKHKQNQAHSSMLIDELNHRVKNTLSTVQSIIWQTLRRSSDPELIREAIESRLMALSHSHDLLSRENWQGAGLCDVVNAAMEPFGIANGRRERFEVLGENIRLPPKATLALGTAFNELATNALKYGAFSNDVGSILITWRTVPSPEGNRLIVSWEEKDGPPVVPPSRKGFGSQIIERGLGHELDGRASLDYRAAGVVCTIDIPVPQVANDG